MNKLILAAGLFALAPLLSSTADAAERGARGELVYQVVKKWGPYVQETYRTDVGTWAKQMGPTFAKASMSSLQQASQAKNFDSMSNALLAQKAAPSKAGADVEPFVLGDPDKDLVFVPVTPCRLFDTRLAGGAISANSVRSFDVTAVSDYSFQGGSASNCGGVGAAGSFAAAVINFTVVTPSGAGYITAFPFGGTQPLASNVNYTAGAVVANLATVQLDQGASANEVSVYTFAQTHLIGDIVGYFINPGPLTMECAPNAPNVVSVAAGATANAVAQACAAGYMQTSTNCESSTWQMPFVFFSGGTCSAQNNSAGNATLRASRTCCRVVRN